MKSTVCQGARACQGISQHLPATGTVAHVSRGRRQGAQRVFLLLSTFALTPWRRPIFVGVCPGGTPWRRPGGRPGGVPELRRLSCQTTLSVQVRRFPDSHAVIPTGAEQVVKSVTAGLADLSPKRTNKEHPGTPPKSAGPSRQKNRGQAGRGKGVPPIRWGLVDKLRIGSAAGLWDPRRRRGGSPRGPRCDNLLSTKRFPDDPPRSTVHCPRQDKGPCQVRQRQSG